MVFVVNSYNVLRSFAFLFNFVNLLLKLEEEA